MRRGDIWLVDFDLVQGSEAARQRPAVIVSNNGANTAAAGSSTGVVTVVPLTTNLAKVYPFQAVLATEETGLRAASKAQAEQVRSVSVGRLGHRIGGVSAGAMMRVDEALRTHLVL